jgi:glycosyltransferase involved in cell wall biosynthesis
MRLSVSMIVKNEEPCLAKCLESVRGADELIVVDSVAAHCPVIIRRNGLTNVVTLEELFSMVDAPIEKTNRGEEIKRCEHLGIETWHRMKKCRNGQSWTKLNSVLRHPYKGKIVRVNTVDGLIDVTPNHALFNSRGRSVVASELAIGDKILEGELRQCHDTGKGRANKFFLGTTELAWCLGVFAAEGSAFKSDGYYHVKWSNKNSALLERCRAAVESGMNLHPQKITQPDKDGMSALICNGESVFRFFRGRFYSPDGEKKVPIEIINSPVHIRKAFLDGYMEGDGHWSRGAYPVYTSKSWILSQGILWLWNSLGYNQWSVFIREDKPNIVDVKLNVTEKRRKIPFSVKKIWSMDYDGMVYDLSTDDGRFQAGVGTIFAHNTGSTDKTKEIALSFGAKVFDFPWVDDFAAARNFAASKCTLPWILYLSADEYLVAPSIDIDALLEGTKEDAIRCKVINTLDSSYYYHGRIYRTGLLFSDRVHEALNAKTYKDSGIVICHTFGPSHALRAERDFRILVEDPKTPRNFYYLAREYWYKKDYVNAIWWWERCIDTSKWLAERSDSYLMLARCYWKMQQGVKARGCCLKALEINANFKEALVLMAKMSWPKNKERWLAFSELATNDDVLFVRE